ncbi:MAG: hypothetical protein ACNA8W_20420, partial [Bradymonadaceae bacterium]
MKTQNVLMMIGGLATVGLMACSTSSSAPFHMYSSPMLEGEMRAQQPRQSNYDPFQLGDHNTTDEVYALEQQKSLPATAQRSEAAPARKSPQRPVGASKGA